MLHFKHPVSTDVSSTLYTDCLYFLNGYTL